MNELLAVLTNQPQTEGMTTSEILAGQQKGDTAFNRNRLLKQLKVEVQAGRVVVGNAVRTRIDGRPSKVPVYRLA